MSRPKLALGLLALCLGAPSPLSALEAEKPPERPSLVVVVVVDQMSAGKLEEFEAQLSGGYKRFLREGHRMTRCHHAHAGTSTGPGHATLLSGLHPRHNGIISNSWYDSEAGREVYCVANQGDDGQPNFDDPNSDPISPDNLRGENLADLVKRANEKSKVYTVSSKDRSAVLTGGHNPDGAFWYSRTTGGFTSNPSIVSELPAWGAEFWGDRLMKSRLFNGMPSRWTYPERPEARPDDYPYENGRFSRVSPHPLNTLAEDVPEDRRTRTRAGQVVFSPWIDWITLQLAERILIEEGLGRDISPDLLVLGLSGADAVGHLYGPGSQEYLDLTLRVDLWLGEFMRRAEEAVKSAGQSGVLFALSADHGVLPLPETVPAARRVDTSTLRERVAAGLATRLGKGGQSFLGEEGQSFLASQQGTDIYLDRGALEEADVTLENAMEEARRVLTAVNGVTRVYRASDLQTSGGGDRFLDLYRNSYDPARSGDLVVQPCENCLFTPGPEGTSHGSPYDYDRRVPMILLGSGVVPAKDTSPCRTVDLVPTLAWFLGLKFESPRDGTRLPVLHGPDSH